MNNYRNIELKKKFVSLEYQWYTVLMELNVSWMDSWNRENFCEFDGIVCCVDIVARI